jgi:transposase
METNTAYPSDLSEAEWRILEPLLPQQRTGRPRKYSQRQMLNALLYLLRSGCAWRLLPHDLPPWQAVYAYFRKLEREGVWIRINDALREMVRQRNQREAEASTLVADSQSVKTTEKGGPKAMTAANESRDASGILLSIH